MRFRLLTIIVLLSFGCRAQQEEIDSLHRLLKMQPKNDTARFRLLIILSDLVLTEQPAECKRYLDEAVSLAKELNFQNGVAESYCSLAYYYWNLSEYPEALEHGLLALRGYEQSKNHAGLYEAYSTLAGIHTSLGEFAKAGEYMNKMLDLGKSGKLEIDYGDLYYNMSWLMLKQNRNEEGLTLINKSLEIAKKEKDPLEIVEVYFLRAKALQGLHKPDAALHDLQRTIQINKSVDHPNASSNIAAAHEAMGDIYIYLKKFDQCALHLDTALRLARRVKSSNLIVKIYGHRVSLHEAQGNFKEALNYERLQSALRDSVFNTEKSQQLAEVQTKYETEKKEQAIQILERDKKIQSLWRNLLIAGLSLVVLISGAIISWLRYRERKNKKLFDLQIDYLTARHQELSLKYKDPVNTVSGDSMESKDHRFLKKALEIVENHITDPLFGVEKMAEELAMTRANLHRKLKSLTGTAPSDFIRNIRLKRAASLLLSQADSISQIGFAVGFEDQSYFSKAFKKHFGVSPSEYGVDH